MVLTSYLPLMISLTRPWRVAGGRADPRLAHPGHCLEQPEQLADVAAAKARVTSGRDQKSGGMARGPNALSRMSLPCLAGACAQGSPEGKTTRYIGAITLRGMGFRAVVAESCCHGET